MSEPSRVASEFEGGEGTGRYDRGKTLQEAGSIVLRDPVHCGKILTHDLYGPATPNVGSAWALPRNHPLWAPMDFESKEELTEDAALREQKLAKFEPPAAERRQLTADEIARVRVKNLEHFKNKKKDPGGRVTFVESLIFRGRRPGYYWGRGEAGCTKGDNGLGIGYHIDYAQMRRLMALDVGDRCEARYRGVRRYFNGVVVKVHDDDCTYDVKFENGHVECNIPCEHLHKKDWVGKVKDSAGGMVRYLKAANPLLEQKDKSVQWYEQLLMWEQGRIEMPQPPEGLFNNTRQQDENQPKTPLQFLQMMAVAEGTDDAAEGTDGVAEGSGGAEALLHADAEDIQIERYEEDTAVDGEPASWRDFALPEATATPTKKEEPRVVTIARVEDVVVSGDVWKPDSAGYKKFWDAEGRPHRAGPPSQLSWYGRSDLSEVERSATREAPWRPCGDSSLIKWIERYAAADAAKPVAGSVAKCHLIGRRLDGTVFETTYDREPRTYKLFCDEDSKGVPKAIRYVQGLHEAICTMRVGEVAHFELVPEKAYGRKGRFPAVPGYSKESPRGTWLHYEIELLDIQDASDRAIVDPSTFGLLERPKGYDWKGIGLDDDSEKRCAYCGKPGRCLVRGRKFVRCGKCKITLYCNAACVKAAWPTHKLTCSSPEDHLVLAALVDASSQLSSDVDQPNEEERLVAYLAQRLEQRRPRICVIAAYRNQLPLQDRQGQLFKFVPYMAAFLGCARPRCDFTIAIATQTDDGRKFNRGRLMNAAFRDVAAAAPPEARYDSVIFHDIDILPSEQLMPYYAVPPSPCRPMHLAGAWRTKYAHPTFVGGAIAFRPDDYVKCNGYPNDCWGWGLDDEELGLRMAEAGLRVVKPSCGTYSDLDPINLHNIVHSDERGYYHEWWNMDIENGKCKPKIFGPIDWNLYSRWWKLRGLADIDGHSELVARTTEFGGRVVRLLYALENDLERKEGTVALVSAKMSLRSAVEHAHLLHGPVADKAMEQTNALAAQGNLRRDNPRLMHKNPHLLTPEEKFKLQGGRQPRRLGVPSSVPQRRRLTKG